MKFKITYAHDIDKIYYRTFENLEEVRDFVIKENERTKACIIWWDTMELVIYDDWIE